MTLELINYIHTQVGAAESSTNVPFKSSIYEILENFPMETMQSIYECRQYIYERAVGKKGFQILSPSKIKMT